MNLLFKTNVICPGSTSKRDTESHAISSNLLICVFYTDLIRLFFKLGFQMVIIKYFVKFANPVGELKLPPTSKG